ncbi:hypothetical protein QLX08_007978 [Tetragonisca angustula]|uniref:Uncharacterized protein n=1 Tax=Tetragonisca angustula TaxID=166442 RepID=A0AAW0ZN53_9HYME
MELPGRSVSEERAGSSTLSGKSGTPAVYWISLLRREICGRRSNGQSGYNAKLDKEESWNGNLKAPIKVFPDVRVANWVWRFVNSVKSLNYQLLNECK